MEKSPAQSEGLNNLEHNLSKTEQLDPCVLWKSVLDGLSKEESEFKTVQFVLDSESDEQEIIEISENDFLTTDEYNLIKLIVNSDASKSIPFVELLFTAVSQERLTVFLENFLTSILGWKSSLDEFIKNAPSSLLFGIKNELALTRLIVLEEVLKKEIFKFYSDKPLKNALKTSEIVELCDFLYYGGAFKNEDVSRISIYRRVGRALNHFASDDSYKNTSSRNIRRDSKLLFINKLKQEFERISKEWNFEKN